MIFITGSAGQLGAVIAKTLARDGHNVVIHSRNSIERAEEVARACRKFGVEATSFIGDLTEIGDFIGRYKAIIPHTTGLVNLVGPYEHNPPSKMSEALKRLAPIILEAPIALTEALLPTLSCIVNFGAAGLSSAWTKASAYGLLKEALWTYTRALSKELASKQVRVNMISPGHLPYSIDLDQGVYLPMGRTVSLEEIAEIVAYCFSEQGRSITGQNIEVAGGVSLV